MTDIALTALRGDNPLAFLAALGALSLASDEFGPQTRMSWARQGTRWTPSLRASAATSEDQVLDGIVCAHRRRDLEVELGWSRDVMGISRDELRSLLAHRLADDDRHAVSLLAACVAELPPLRRDDQLASYTPFRLIPRVGRSRFLQTALAESREGTEHIKTCLTATWSYVPHVNALRWDPGSRIQARALMSDAPSHVGQLGVRGAVLLAVRGLSFFPLLTATRRARPRGMPGGDRFIWPIWDAWLDESATRLLLGLPWLYEPDEAYEQLSAHHVAARYVARRIRDGSDDQRLGWGEPITPESAARE